MNHNADIRLPEPASTPGPVGVDGVDHPRHQDAEQDVAIKIAALGDCSRDDCGAGGSKGALRLLILLTLICFSWIHISTFYIFLLDLEKEEGIILERKSNQSEIRVSNEL